MKELYLDCGMGCAGDMLSAALYELCPDKAAVIDRLNSIGIPHVKFTAEKAMSCCVSGTHMKVEYMGEEERQGEYNDEKSRHHHHHGYKDILHLIDSFSIDEEVKENAKAVYTLIASAEAGVHDREMENIHFHELGTMDAVADVTASALIMSILKPDHISVSPLRIGYGAVRCAHGIMPVPAPATTLLLLGIPVFTGDIACEMCTPTGAALIKYFADDFGKMPDMTMTAIGYGIGSKEFDRPNCVRAILGSI